MPLLKTKAVILRSHRWGDADRIVTFFSLQFGKIRGVARGARRQKSRYFLQKPYELDQIAKVCKELSQPVGACSDSASRAASSEVTRV